MDTLADNDDRVEGAAKLLLVERGELGHGAGNNALRGGTDTAEGHGESLRGVAPGGRDGDGLVVLVDRALRGVALRLGEEHLREGLVWVHEARRLVDEAAPGESVRAPVMNEVRVRMNGVTPHKSPDLPSHVLLALLAHLDIKEDERVHAKLEVLLETVVPRVRGPGGGVERQRDGLAKVVHLQTGGSERSHNGGIVDRLRGDAASVGAEKEVGVRRRAVC